MFSKLSVFLASAAALLCLAIVVRGQDDTHSSAPWPFGRSLNLLRWPTNDNNSNSNNGNAASGAQDGSSNSSSNSNSSNTQPLHSVTIQSQSNRRLYGPSQAISAGVVDGYAPQNTAPSKMAPRVTAGDMKPVVTQGTLITTGSPTDLGARPSFSEKALVHGSTADASQPRSSVAESPLSQDLKSDDSMPHDSRSLQERLAAIRQSSETDRSAPVAEKPLVEKGAVPISSATVESTAGDTKGDSPRQFSTIPAEPNLKAGPSSRRVVISSEDADDVSASTPGLATPNKPASVGMVEHSDSTAGSQSSKPRSAKSDLIEAAPSHSSVHASPEIATAESSSPTGAAVLFTRQSPLVSVETTGPRTIIIGKIATYTVTIRNAGEIAAPDLSVTVKIPEWTDVAGSQASAGTIRAATAEGAEPFQWRIPRLEAHGKETLALRLLPRKGRGFDLAVQWAFSPIATQTSVDVQEPKLDMTIAGPDEVVYGQSKLFRLTISNPGTGDAENVVVQLDPIGNSAAPASKHPIGTIRAGDSKVVELELTARQSGTLSIHATASAEPGLKAEAAQEVLVRRAAVALAVEGAKTRYSGTTASYAIQVTNPGNAVADNVHVFAALPPGAKFVSASAGGQWKSEQGKVVWSLPALRPGSDSSFDLKCSLANPGPNRIQITSSAAGDVSDVANITTNVEALADLKLDVSEPAGPIGVGDEVAYELRVHNRGSKAADGVGVVIYFSEGIEPVSAQGGAHDISNGVVAFRPLPTLSAGGDLTLKVKARAEHSGKQVFRAEVECGALGTKLVNAEEMMVYGGDDAPGLQRPDRAIAGRNPPLQSVPGQSDDGASKSFRR